MADPGTQQTNRDTKDAEGYVTQSATAILQIDAPLEKTQIVAPHADVLFVRNGSNFRCHAPRTSSRAPTVSLAGWTGRVEVFVGKISIRRSVNPALKIEDLSRPRTVSWLDGNSGPKLRTAPDPPMVVSLQAPEMSKTPRGVIGCRGHRFREKPDYALRVERSLVI